MSAELSESHQRPTPQPLLPALPRRHSFSRFFGAYSGSVFCSPIWYGVLALAFETGPKAMTLGVMTQLQNEQFGKEAYWITNGSMVLMSLISTPGLAVCGFLSQPHRLGRKNVMVFLTLVSIAATFIPVFTENMYTVTGLQMLVSVTGCDRMNSALFVCVLAWITDWANPSDKMTYFAILMGSMFGAMSVTPFIPKMLGFAGSDTFLLSGYSRALSFIFMIFIFPADTPYLSARTPNSILRRFEASPRFLRGQPQQDSQRVVRENSVATTHDGSSPPAASSSVAQGQVSDAMNRGLTKSMRHISASVKYLFRNHGMATTIYLMINFTDAAVQDSIVLYLMGTKHFTTDDLNTLIAIIGGAGFFMQTFAIPAMNACGLSSKCLLMLSCVAMVVHFGVYAFSMDKSFILAMEPFGSFGYIGTIATTALISGSSSSEELPRDQGTLMGALNGMKTLASCVGPLTLAAFTSYYEMLPAPLNFAGVGFALLTAMMFVAFLCSIRLLLQKEKTACSGNIPSGLASP